MTWQTAISQAGRSGTSLCVVSDIMAVGHANGFAALVAPQPGRSGASLCVASDIMAAGHANGVG